MNDIYETMIMEAVNKISDNMYGNIRNLAQYPPCVAKQVLRILIQYACVCQNYKPIQLARNKIGEIVDRHWLIEHFMEAVDESIDYSDEWEYRRFMELVELCVPEIMDSALAKGINCENKEVREVAEEFINAVIR